MIQSANAIDACYSPPRPEIGLRLGRSPALAMPGFGLVDEHALGDIYLDYAQ